MPGPIHVAGNAVLDIVVHGRGGGDGSAADGWGDNVELLDTPVAGVLGGCGAAPAYVLARLGAEVSLSSNLGDDAFGGLLRGWLEPAGVRLRPPASRGAATAVHVIHLHEARRRSAYWRGRKVDWAAGLGPERPAWFVAAGYGAVDADDLTVLTGVCADLRGAGCRICFDPGPWFAGRAGIPQMLALWAQVDVLCATEQELAAWLPACESAADLAASARACGPDTVVVKQGARGACWAAADGTGHAPAPTVPAGSSVGAGDAFHACLVHALDAGRATADAVAAAVDLATRVVAAGRGVLGALPPVAPIHPAAPERP